VTHSCGRNSITERAAIRMLASLRKNPGAQRSFRATFRRFGDNSSRQNCSLTVQYAILVGLSLLPRHVSHRSLASRGQFEWLTN
jgi:hypothetical protein